MTSIIIGTDMKHIGGKRSKTDAPKKDPPKEDKSTGKIVSSDDINVLTTNDIFRLMDLHFYRQYYIFNHLYNSYNKFLDEDVKNFLEQNEHIFNEKITSNTVYKQKFVFENVMVVRPTLDNGVEPMFPSDARHRGLTYSIRLIADVTQVQEVIDIASDEIQVKQVGEKEERVPIAVIPLMLRSKYCSLTQYRGNDKNECEYDPGGYFIVNGSEKVIISQDRMVENKPLVFIKKDSGTVSHVVQVNSRSYKSNGMIQAISIKLKKDGMMTIRVPILNEVNVFAVFRALGIESDRDIIDYTVYDENDTDMIDVLMTSINACRNDKGEKIQTQDEAIDYLINKLRVIKKYTETDKNTKLVQKKKHLSSLLKSSLLPHVEGGHLEKAYYLGYMINKLLRVYLGRLPVDDRDSYINKRIDLPGDLLFELFKQQYKKMLSECNKFFTNRNDSDDKPINIINQIKPNTIEQGLKAALLTGSWIRRKGVAQMLQRLTYVQTLAFLRRVDAPSSDATSVKLTSPRHLHPSSVGFLCCVTGDSEVLMSDNTTVKRIKDIKDGDAVMTVNPDNLYEEPSRMKNWFTKMPEKLLKITTISGRELKCTPDHPILIRRDGKYEMIDAENLKQNDSVIIRPLNRDDQSGNVIEFNQYKEFNMNPILSLSDFNAKYNIDGVHLAIPLKTVEEIPPEPVYDFETCSDNHTFIVNGFVTHNCVQTPEHAKVGLTKHLSIIASISIMSEASYNALRDILLKRVMNIRDIPITKMRDMFKIFLNGEWLGMIYDPHNLEMELSQMKLSGALDQRNVSIVPDYHENEIRVYCDSGRMYRPVMRIEDNVILLKKKHIDKISLNKAEKMTKITDWDEFLMKHPGVIEYIDMELMSHLLIADKVKTVEEMRQIMIKSINKVKDIKDNNVTNRYDDMFFLKYTHCEFHPSLLVGEISTNIPFCDRNQGPRLIFNYAQSRQAMGIYATNYRDRLDISYILYHPQKPLVTTRTSKYIGTDILPAGENCTVAIASYTGLLISPCRS